VLEDVEVPSLLDRGFRGLAKVREHWHAPVGDRRTIDRLTDQQRAYNRLQAGLRALVEQSIAHLANAGRCAAGVGCLTASGTSTAPSARSSASAAGCTGFPPDKSITDTLIRPSKSASRPARACGLDQHQVRRWCSCYRWTTLAMVAHAFLVVLAATRLARHRPSRSSPSR
jgi:hypothetical protein